MLSDNVLYIVFPQVGPWENDTTGDVVCGRTDKNGVEKCMAACGMSTLKRPQSQPYCVVDKHGVCINGANAVFVNCIFDKFEMFSIYDDEQFSDLNILVSYEKYIVEIGDDIHGTVHKFVGNVTPSSYVPRLSYYIELHSKMQAKTIRHYVVPSNAFGFFGYITDFGTLVFKRITDTKYDLSLETQNKNDWQNKIITNMDMTLEYAYPKKDIND